MSSRLLHCYAEGVNGEWEAICLDFDIAVQGSSFEDVSASLRTAITLYLQSVADLPEGERGALLERTAPLRVRVKFLAYAIRELLVAGTDHDESRLAAHHALVHPMAAALPVEFVPTGGENAEEVRGTS